MSVNTRWTIWLEQKGGHISENEACSILKSGIVGRDMLKNVLMWKTGKKETCGHVAKISISQLWEVIAGFELSPIERPVEFLREVYKVPGIGVTYAITLLYFMTGGSKPIYDQFAHRALYAAIEGKRPKDTINLKLLTYSVPTKNAKTSAGMDHFYSRYRCEYANWLVKDESPFGSRYVESRDVDSALWAYGHQFSASSDDPHTHIFKYGS